MCLMPNWVNQQGSAEEEYSLTCRSARAGQMIGSKQKIHA